MLLKSTNFLELFALIIISISPILSQSKPPIEPLKTNVSTPIKLEERINLTNKPTQINSFGPDLERAKRYVYIAGATYCFDELENWSCENCQKAQALGYDFVAQVNHTILNTVGVIVINYELKEIVVGFRGTINLPNIIEDFYFVPPVPVTGFGLFNNPDIKVQGGYLLATNSLYEKLLNHLKILLLTYPDYSLIVTGHSLGAGMASIFLYKIMEGIDLPPAFPPPASFAFFGYGEPRIGNRAYADYWNAKNMQMTRVVNKRDIISHTPPPSGLSSGYIHHGNELWINLSDEVVTCSKAVYEDPNCSNSVGPFYSFQNHLSYFDVSIASCALSMPISFLEQFVFQ